MVTPIKNASILKPALTQFAHTNKFGQTEVETENNRAVARPHFREHPHNRDAAIVGHNCIIGSCLPPWF